MKIVWYIIANTFKVYDILGKIASSVETTVYNTNILFLNIIYTRHSIDEDTLNVRDTYQYNETASP